MARPIIGVGVSLFLIKSKRRNVPNQIHRAGFVADYRSLLFLASLVLAGVAATGQKKPVKPTSGTIPTFAKDVLPTTTKFCAGCHQGKDAPAGVNFDKFKTESNAKADLALWERASRAISTGSMPPKGMPAPSKLQRAALSEWVERAISADCRLADPGRVTIRRLNREEYNNTIRDLTGLDLKPAEDFPSDDVGYGFDNIGDVLSISPLLMEKYLTAAEKVAKQAIYIPGAKSITYQAEEFANANGEFAFLATRGEIVVNHDFKPGMYRIKVRAYEDHAGPESVKMQLSVNQTPLQLFDVTARRSAPGVYEAPFKSEGGKTRVSVSFLNDFYRAENPPGDRDRNLHVDYFEIAGPLGGAFSMPDSHRKIIPSDPPAGKEKEYARKAITTFAGRAYRRPATSEELERLMSIFDLAKKYNEPFERGMQLAVQATLVSPNFLFRAEVDPKTNPTASRSLNGYELASRLSYFLWSSMPDDRLLTLAGDGSLAKPQILTQEVRRMLRSPKSEALADNFAAQWLTLRKLAIINPDVKQFPFFNASLKDAMATETKMFFQEVVSKDRSVLDFIDGKFTFVNGQLARHYGIPNINGPEFQKISLAGSDRGGVLTHASVLTVTSNPTRTSPTKRGRWVLEQLLGTPPPPPPPGVDVLKDENQIDSAKSLREKMIQHRKDPACASCHSKMDPLGFGLENFDPTGAWRKQEGGYDVDASGVLPDGTKFSGPTQLKNLLMKDKDQFVKSLSEKLLTYALGRGVSFADRCHLDTIVKQTQKGGYKFSALVEAVVQSDPFRKRKIQN